jgi:hypothetical protein
VGWQEVARCGMATVTIDQANRFGDELSRRRTRRRLRQLDLATRAGTTQR